MPVVPAFLHLSRGPGAKLLLPTGRLPQKHLASSVLGFRWLVEVLVVSAGRCREAICLLTPRGFLVVGPSSCPCPSEPREEKPRLEMMPGAAQCHICLKNQMLCLSGSVVVVSKTWVFGQVQSRYLWFLVSAGPLGSLYLWPSLVFPPGCPGFLKAPIWSGVCWGCCPIGMLAWVSPDTSPKRFRSVGFITRCFSILPWHLGIKTQDSLNRLWEM